MRIFSFIFPSVETVQFSSSPLLCVAAYSTWYTYDRSLADESVFKLNRY
jgi:hypothetical protein